VDSGAELVKGPTEISQCYGENWVSGLVPATVDEDAKMVCVRLLVRWIVNSGAELVSDPAKTC
jgi:hypothetical protein